jgi:hypothetical protein
MIDPWFTADTHAWHSNIIGWITQEDIAAAFVGNPNSPGFRDTGGVFDRIQVNFATSGGFDTISWEYIPEPTSFVLLSLSGLVLALRRR